MDSIESRIRRVGFFRRRRDLLRDGFTDHQIVRALVDHRIFRVRQGWFSVPDAPVAAVRAVRVGGRLTSVSALESYGLPVPRRPVLHVTVAATASRLRTPDDRRRRLAADEDVHVHWSDGERSRGSIWRVSLEEALLATLIEEPRDIAVACASALMRHQGWSGSRLAAVFRRAPMRARSWLPLVSALDDSHGETFFRLWITDARIAFEQQVKVAGVGRFDFKVGPHSYVEIDGAQHDPGWTGATESSWQKDHRWDMVMAINGDHVLRFTYLQLYSDWPNVLRAMRRSIADGRALEAYRRTHPYRSLSD